MLSLGHSRSQTWAVMPLRLFLIFSIRRRAEVRLRVRGMVLLHLPFQLVFPHPPALHFWAARLVARFLLKLFPPFPALMLLGLSTKAEDRKQWTHGLRFQMLHPGRHCNLGRVLGRTHGAMRMSGQSQSPSKLPWCQRNTLPHILGGHARLRVVLLPRLRLCQQPPTLGVRLLPNGMSGAKWLLICQ